MTCIAPPLKTETLPYVMFPGIKFNLIIACLIKGYDCFSTTPPPVWVDGTVPPDSLWHYHQPPEPERQYTQARAHTQRHTDTGEQTVSHKYLLCKNFKQIENLPLGSATWRTVAAAS